MHRIRDKTEIILKLLLIKDEDVFRNSLIKFIDFMHSLLNLEYAYYERPVQVSLLLQAPIGFKSVF